MRPMGDISDKAPISTGRRLIWWGVAVMVGALVWFSIAAAIRDSDARADDFLRETEARVGIGGSRDAPDQVNPLPYALGGGVGALMVLSGVILHANDPSDHAGAA